MDVFIEDILKKEFKCNISRQIPVNLYMIRVDGVLKKRRSAYLRPDSVRCQIRRVRLCRPGQIPILYGSKIAATILKLSADLIMPGENKLNNVAHLRGSCLPRSWYRTVREGPQTDPT